MNVPEKHRAFAHAWVDGEEIECQFNNFSGTGWCLVEKPEWDINSRYRIKPKAKVKKWRWVYRSEYAGCLLITDCFLSEAEARAEPEILQKIDSTMIPEDE